MSKAEQNPGDVTLLFRGWQDGGRASASWLFEVMRPVTDKMATAHFRRDRHGHGLQPTIDASQHPGAEVLTTDILERVHSRCSQCESAIASPPAGAVHLISSSSSTDVPETFKLALRSIQLTWTLGRHWLSGA